MSGISVRLPAGKNENYLAVDGPADSELQFALLLSRLFCYSMGSYPDFPCNSTLKFIDVCRADSFASQ